MITNKTSNYLTYYISPIMLCLVICTLFCGTNITKAQTPGEGVGINTTSIDPSAILHIENTYDDNNLPKGLKLPSYDASEIADLESFGQAGNGLNRGLLFFSNENNQIYQVADYDNTPFIEPIGWGMHGNDLSDLSYSSFFLGTTDPSRFSLGTDDTKLMTFMETGEIVIGTSQSVASDASFQINGTKGLLLPRLTASDRLNIQSPTPGLFVYDTDYNALYVGIADIYGNSTWSVVGGGSGGSDADWTIGSGVIYNETDNVGIGNTGNTTTSLYITGSGTNAIGIYNLQQGTTTSFGVGNWNINNMSTNNLKIGFWSNVNSTGTGGRYGIINQVAGNSSSTADIYGIYSDIDGAGSSSFYGLRLLNEGTGTGTDYGIYSTGEDINYFEGSVGIGTDAPTSQLHLAHPLGSANGFTLQNSYDNDKWHWYVYSNNDLTLFFNGSQRGGFDDVSGNYTASSDRRLKKSITPVGGVLNDLMKLNLVEYNYKQQSDKRKYTGFIAQEVKEIFPSLVYYQDEEDLFFMDYAGVGPLAVKAIQEQQKMIEKLQEKVLMLENKIAQMDDE